MTADIQAKRLGTGADARRVRVAALIDTAIVSGPGRQLTALATELSRCGVDLRVFMFQRRGRPPSPFISYLETAGVSHAVIPDKGPFDIRLLRRLDVALAAWSPDIVQTHNYRTTVLAFALRLLGRRWKWLAFFHGATSESWRIRLYNRIDKALLPKADRLVVMSRRQQQIFARLRDDVDLIYNAVLQLPKSDPIDLPVGRSSDVRLIGAVSRLSFEKGLDVLIAALPSLPRDISLVIAGDGPEKRALIAQAGQLGVSSRVHFLGTVADVGNLYDQLDVVVLPSRSEGLPNVLLEALAADVPVVATDVGAVPEVLTIPEAGEIASSEDVASLANAIRRALSHGRSEAATAARKIVATRFSLATRVQAHLKLYHEVLRTVKLPGNTTH